MDSRILESPSPLFAGISPENRRSMLHCIGHRQRTCPKGEIIVFEEESVRHVGLILSGAVDMVKEDIWGGRTLLLRMGPHELFGETFACGSDSSATVTFVVAEDSEVLFLPFRNVLHTCTHVCDFHYRLIENMVRVIADKNRELLQKVEIISRKTLREKILAYLSRESERQGSRYVELPLGRQELAAYLCADRSALTRELAGMKADGLIDYERNLFRILT